MADANTSQGVFPRLQAAYGMLRAHSLKGFHLLPEPLQRVLANHRWKFLIGTSVFLLLGYGYYALTREPEPEIITAEVTRGEIVQTVEAVGEITSERDLKLQFPISGVVQQVLVKEGDAVKAGQRLAALRAGDLSASVQSALASLQAAQAEHQELKEGTRPEDIAIAEAELANKEAQLESARDALKSAEEKLALLQTEAGVSVGGGVGEAESTASKEITVARTAIGVFDDVMADPDVIDAFQRGSPGKDRVLKLDRDAAESTLKATASDFQFEDTTEALKTLREVRSGVASVAKTMDDLFMNLTTLPPTSTFTRAEREARKNDVATEKTNLQSALSAIDSSLKDLQDAVAGYDTKIATEQTAITSAKGDILNLETSIRTETAKLALKRAGARPTEIQAAAARVRQAQADYERAVANYSDTVLFAPVAGSITKVNIKEGELLSTAFQQDAAITMLGDAPYRIEIYASEVDIPKVALAQTGSIKLDSFPDRLFALTVAEIDPSATDVDGVPKYRIKLDFLSLDPGIKIGMTGDVDIVTGRAADVLLVPARAVLENDFGDTYVRILASNGEIEDRRVEVGLQGENDVEIVRGLEEGEEVIVLLKE